MGMMAVVWRISSFKCAKSLTIGVINVFQISPSKEDARGYIRRGHCYRRSPPQEDRRSGMFSHKTRIAIRAVSSVAPSC
uniref:Putative secreted protein n=1 Tax=Panstrongylus lignarius TaxID=156445 RepID=A0A224Y005_9HEMI